MKYVVKETVDGESRYSVVEADNPNEAALWGGVDMLTEDGRELVEKHEVSLIGVYEMGHTNLLEAIDKNFETHRHYRNKIKELGFNPDSYEKL